MVDDRQNLGRCLDDQEVELDLLRGDVIELLQRDLLLQPKFRQLLVDKGFDFERVEEIAHDESSQYFWGFGLREVLKKGFFDVGGFDQVEVKEIAVFFQEKVDECRDLLVRCFVCFQMVHVLLPELELE